jgi:N utilization substance protein A
MNIFFNNVRGAARNNVYDEYISRIGELVHGFVKRFEGGRIITDLGKVEAVLPKTQQSRAESFSQGERLRIVINSVSKDSKGPQVEVSRTSPELLKRLFEMEVPEIYDGTVQIKAAVREPGDRAKIAVISTERDVDPVGACVGMKGSRVQAIIRELRGERIDIIEWSEDPAVFAANALSPAKVSKVEINSFEEKKLTVTVPEDQLSLAIGKKGQNVRLAAKLVGWHIDIRSAEEAARAAAAQLEAVMAGGEASLTDIRESLALDQITAERLKDRGIENIEQLSTVTVDELVDAIDVSFDQATEILERAHRLLAQKHAREARQARESEEALVLGGEALPVEEEEVEETAAAPVEVSEEALQEEPVEAGDESADESAADESIEAHEGPSPAPAEETEGVMSQETIEATEEDATEVAVASQDATPEAVAVAEAVTEGEQVAPPESAFEPDPPRPSASAIPDFDSMSPTEEQIQEVLADEPAGIDVARGPMPAAGLEALAPGAQVIAESRREWAEEAGFETSSQEAVEEEVLRDLAALEEADEPSEGQSPSEAAETETGEEQTDELSPEIFEETGTETQEDVAEGDENSEQ